MKIQQSVKLILASICFCFGCKTQKSLFDAQFNYEGHFYEYESFGFMDSGLQEDLDHDKVVIEFMIYKRLIALGYKYNPINPDLAIGLKYFKEGTKLNTWNQESIHQWLEHGQSSLLPIEKYSTRLEVNDFGTLSIFFIDLPHGGSIIFQSHCKFYKPEQPEYLIISSVCRMLDKYKITTYE